MSIEKTFDGKWSSDEGDDVEDLSEDKDTPAPSNKRIQKKSPNPSSARKNFWSHKFRSLAGKHACKYCDSIFASKVMQRMHFCRYLKCDPKNFICRICNKELSRKTFSNHLHETLDCQYCGKSFVNPRNMKSHIENKHKHERFIPPKKKVFDEHLVEKEKHEEAMKAEVPKVPRLRNEKIKTRFECGKFSEHLEKYSYLHKLNSRSLRQIPRISPLDVISHVFAHGRNCLHLRKLWRKVLHAERHQAAFLREEATATRTRL